MTSIYQQWTDKFDDNIKDVINGYLFEEQRKLKEDIHKTFHRVYLDGYMKHPSRVAWVKIYDHRSFNTQDIPFLDCIDIWSISPELIDSIKVYISVKYAIRLFERFKYRKCVYSITYP